MGSKKGLNNSGLIIGATLALVSAGFFAYVSFESNRPDAPGSDRMAERLSNLKSLKEKESIALNQYRWIDEDKGVVGLPIGKALAITAEEWSNPVGGRNALLDRLQRSGKQTETASSNESTENQ